MTITLILLSLNWFALASKPAHPSREDAKYIRPWYDEKSYVSLFEHFIRREGRSYTDESEKEARLEIFIENLKKINNLHLKSSRYHAIYGLTQFMDMTSTEFNSMMNGLGGFQDLDTTPCEIFNDEHIDDHDAPDSFDWRDYGGVTPVKDQGNCGGCYAFSAIANIESQYAIQNKEMLSLSEQQILDCDEINSGCSGGFMNVAMRTLINYGGCQSEKDYPYDAKVNTCSFDGSKLVARISNCQSFNLTSQKKLKQLLYQIGPIAIGVRATNLQFYIRGIMPNGNCDVGEINHGALLVGYGTQEDGNVKYWIVKNSWGVEFGEDGYFRMARGKNARSCGVMNEYMASSILS